MFYRLAFVLFLLAIAIVPAVAVKAAKEEAAMNKSNPALSEPVYTEKIEQRPYWTLRTYGFELSEGCLVVGIETGSAFDQSLLKRIELNISSIAENL